MNIKSIILKNFRSYENKTFCFEDGVNVIRGENGCGKTNILEAISLFSGVKSFRADKYAELIRWEQPEALINADIQNRGRNFDMLIRIVPGSSEKWVNGVTVKKNEMCDYFRCVLFSPDDLYLIKSREGRRRTFMDRALSQVTQGYYDALYRYNKIKKSKSSILENDGDLSLLREYNLQLAGYGARLILQRNKFVSVAGELAQNIHREISGDRETLALKYRTVDGVEDAEAQKDKLVEILYDDLERAKKEEIYKRKCIVGPHDDDIDVFINGREAKHFASQGQCRTAAIAMKFAEREMLRDGDEYPVLLLDDVLSELDEPRRSFITANAFGGQTVITCCGDLDEKLPQNIITL